MSFASPAWLLVLVVIPALLLWRWAHRHRAPYAIRFPAATSARLAAAGISGGRRWIPAGALLCALAVLALALARPRMPHKVPVGQTAIMLVSDHSGSMAADDVQPTRLGAAVRAADSFIAALPGSVRLGAIGFSTTADGVQGPVPGHAAARSIIDSQSAGGGTATGDALALALQLLHGGTRHPPSAIVLLSDGAANAGVDALSVARQARQEGIPIYTVALGTPSGVLNSPDPLSGPIPVPPDPELMARLAATSGGRTFNAQSADQLASIYTHLAGELGSVTRQRDIARPVAALGGVLLLAAAAAAVRWGPRLP